MERIALQIEENTMEGQREQWIRYAAMLCAAATIVLGGVVLVGWAADVGWLKSVYPGFTTMKPNTALCFVCLGAALLMMLFEGLGSVRLQNCRRALTLFVLLLISLTLLEITFQIDLHIDEMIFRDTENPTGAPGRMTAVSVFIFLLLGTTLLLGRGRRTPTILYIFAIVSALNSAFALLCYLFGAQALLTVGPAAQAVHTAAAFLLLSVGLLLAFYEQGIVKALTADGVGGMLVRRLLPATILLPILVGWARLQWQRWWQFNIEAGISIQVVATIVVFNAFVFWTARQLGRFEKRQRQADESLRESDERFRLVFESSSTGLILASADGRMMLVNNYVAETFGYTHRELLGCNIELLVPERLREEHEAHRASYMTAPHSRPMGVNRELRGRRRDGSEFPVEVSLNPIEIQGENHILVSIVDISVRKGAAEALRQSENRFRQLADAMPQIVWAAGPNGQVDYCNRRWYQLTGAPADETDHAQLLQHLHADDRQRFRERWFKCIQSGSPFELEYRLKFPDTADYRWYLGRALPVHDEDGNIVRWYGTSTDIDDFKRVELALRASELRFRVLLESLPQLVWTCSSDGRCDYLGPQWVRYTGVPEAEHLNYGWADALHPSDRERAFESWKNAVATDNRFDIEFRIRDAQGHYRWFKTRAVRFTSSDGSEKWFGTNTDIDDQKRAEEQVRRVNEALEWRVKERTADLMEANESLRLEVAERRHVEDDLRQTTNALDAIQDGVFMFDPESLMYSYVNEGAVKQTGYSRAELLNMTPLDIKSDIDESTLRVHLSPLSEQSSSPLTFTTVFRNKSGKEIPVEAVVQKVHVSEGQGRYVAVVRDISERQHAEEQLRESEARFRTAFDDAPIGMALVAPDGRWLRVNRSLCNGLGYTEEELLATKFQAITYPDDLEADLNHVQAVLAGKIRSYQMEKRYLHRQGHVVHGLLSVSLVRDRHGRPLYFTSQVIDITERIKYERRIKASLREKEVLLKEIHHRVKNNLQIVSTLLDLQAEHTTDVAAREMFKESQGRVKTMALIHERLYRSEDLANVNLADYVGRLAEDLFRTYKVSTGIELAVDVDIAALPIDIAIPCGLLLNELVSNCLKHAFTDNRSGVIQISLIGRGKEGTLTVRDNGVGLPEQLDPHSTSTFGLQLVVTLVEQVHGKLEYLPREGAEFIVRFPIPGESQQG